MDEAIFRDKLDRLREGKVILLPPEKNVIGRHARQHLPDLLEYTASVEDGYRILMGRLSAYRGVANERALGRIVKNQWSSPAALGYAAAALRQSGMSPSQVVGVLELMEELMGEQPRAWAEGVYQEMTEDPGGDGNGRPGDPAGDADSSTPRDGRPVPYGAQNDYEGDGGPGDPAPTRDGGTDCHGKHGGQGKREQRQQPGGLLRAVADGYAGSDNPCICADSGRPTPRNDRAGDGA